MAEIVLVHGIDQQQKSADMLESEWVPSLAGGVRTAGFPDVADRIWRDAGNPGSIETRMAFYGAFSSLRASRATTQASSPPKRQSSRRR